MQELHQLPQEVTQEVSLLPDHCQTSLAPAGASKTVAGEGKSKTRKEEDRTAGLEGYGRGESCSTEVVDHIHYFSSLPTLFVFLDLSQINCWLKSTEIHCRVGGLWRGFKSSFSSKSSCSTHSTGYSIPDFGVSTLMGKGGRIGLGF